MDGGEMAAAAGHARRAGRSHAGCAAARSGYLDYSHPIFERVQGSAERQLRERALLQVPRADAGADRPRARAIRRRRGGDGRSGAVGSGRVIAFTSTLDAVVERLPDARACSCRWCTRRSRYLAQYDEPEAWYTVGPHARHLRRRSRRSCARARPATPVGATRKAERRRDVAVGRAGDARRGRRAVGRARRAGVLLRAAAGHGRAPAVRGGGQPRSGRVRSDGAAAGRVSSARRPAARR